MDAFRKLAVIVLLLVIIAGFIVLIMDPVRPTEIIITPGVDGPEYRFGVFGAVREPGYYSAEGPIRIEDAVLIAGGTVDNADIANAHLAKWIDDGETVIIPTIGMVQPTITPIMEDQVIVDLNHADIDELMKLPGIGEKRANDIIQLRERKGGFSSKEDILEISGISERLLESIYDQLIVK